MTRHPPFWPVIRAAMHIGAMLTGMASALAGVAGAQRMQPAQARGSSSAAPTAAGTRLGGPGRRPLGASVSIRLGDPAPPSLDPTPPPATAPKSSFRVLADAIDDAGAPR